MSKPILLFNILLIFFFNDSVAQNHWTPIFHSESTEWADSILASLSEEERIAQLFMVSAYSNKDDGHRKEIVDLIQRYNIGGIMFLKGSTKQQVKLTNYFQSKSKTPLMIAIDAEWGVAMRLDSIRRFPWQMSLGAIKDAKLIYKMGSQIAHQCKMLGININFAPVADINSNPKNPIIGNRSFGESPEHVSKLSEAYMRGLQDNRVLACAKHFPGHGDTDSDSHKTLPVVRHSRYRINKTELVPFKDLITNGLGSIMVAHLRVPSIDYTNNLASSLSKKVVKKLLKEELGFQGLVFTDALNMRGVSKYFDSGELEVRALLAGNDVLLMSENIEIAIQAIKQAIIDKKITQEEIDLRCRKILIAKKWMGLNQLSILDTSNLVNKINTLESELTNRMLVEQSITLLQNYDDLLPLKGLDTLNIANLSIGDDNNYFNNMLSNYTHVTDFFITEELDVKKQREMLDRLLKFNLIIVGIHTSNNNPWEKHAIARNIDLFLQTLTLQSKVVLVVFANPYTINDLLFTRNFDALIMGYQNSKFSQEYVAQAIFGGIPFQGALPVSTKHYNRNTGISTENIRLKYTIPEELNISPLLTYKIDSIVKDAIFKKAMPGCQIFIAKDSKVFFHKSYGYHTYSNINRVKKSDLYDLASITKIIATLPILMSMQEEGAFGLGYKLGRLDKTLYKFDKGFLRVREVLAHQSGLRPWIPFYKRTIDDNNNLRDTLYSTRYSSEYPIRVAEDLYLHKTYPDTIFSEVLSSDMNDEKQYQYSDLGYYMFKEIIEKYYNKPLEFLVNDKIYKKLGLSTMGYLPKERFLKDQLIPTERDVYFRNQLLVGDVHDMGAAMLGGVGGHAGLFSNANDLGIVMQMYLHMGEYGGYRYFKSKTIKEYTKCQFCNEKNRRGAGFDKPALPEEEGGSTCKSISHLSFGHSGFTGTLAWADPEKQIVYIFLSNRIHPDASNTKLLDMNVRTNIMQIIYDYIK